MGYSTPKQVQDILASTLTRGTNDDFPVDIINVGNQVRDTVRPDTFIQYIRWADEQIDAALSVVYQVPLKRIVKGEYDLLADINSGDDTIRIEDSTRFHVGDIINLNDRVVHEKQIIAQIPDETTIVVVSPFTQSFTTVDGVVQRIGYPDPMPLVSARMAASSLYDKYFSSQSSTSTSDYGKELRIAAENNFNNVLNGRSKLMGQRIIGRRFYNPALQDSNNVPSGDKNRGGGS
jgi:hypothetical protein